ncbi:MAG: SGNH/GDSL hydrolase family protein [Planctomycetota bacterium]
MKLRSVVYLLLGCALAGTVVTPAYAQNKKKQNPVLAPIEDDPGLPRVLIIGDSISMGYTLDTRAMLKGKANLHRPPTNCGPTTRGLEQLDDWLGEGKWDVIHFNWGLHDLKYQNEKGQLVDADKGKQQVSIEQYAKNLEALVERLKKTDAKLIWRNTTPVPEGSKGRVAGDAARYNAAAAEVMAKHDVQTHDLYTFAKEHEKEIQLPKNVHYTKAGSKKLAEQVVAVIEAALSGSR